MNVEADFRRRGNADYHQRAAGCEHLQPLVDAGRIAVTLEDQVQPLGLVAGDDLEVDFASGTATDRGETFRFSPLGSVPQSLVVAGGIENQVRERLNLG